MVKKQLLDWIKKSRKKGFTFEVLHEQLVQHGYGVADVTEAINNIKEYEQNSFHRNNQIFMSIAIILILAGLFIVIAYFSQPVCGDGKIGKGETAMTCCVDVACDLGESCKQNNNPTTEEQLKSVSFFSRNAYVFSCVTQTN